MSEEKTIDSEKYYEEDVINFRAILFFIIGLAALIIITFILMWVLQYKVLVTSSEGDDTRNSDPLGLTDSERLPPEPRLQSAPGFGVGTGENRVPLQLREPSAEWKELRKQYQEIWEEGEKAEDGTVISMPVEEAKIKLLESGELKSKTGKEAEEAFAAANSYVSAASAGRLAAGKRR